MGLEAFIQNSPQARIVGRTAWRGLQRIANSDESEIDSFENILGLSGENLGKAAGKSLGGARGLPVAAPRLGSGEEPQGERKDQQPAEVVKWSYCFILWHH
jgi:hypothetical protein